VPAGRPGERERGERGESEREERGREGGEREREERGRELVNNLDFHKEDFNLSSARLFTPLKARVSCCCEY
jgi:hypothetical protein